MAADGSGGAAAVGNSRLMSRVGLGSDAGIRVGEGVADGRNASRVGTWMW
jgi:hypothetical protein